MVLVQWCSCWSICVGSDYGAGLHTCARSILVLIMVLVLKLMLILFLTPALLLVLLPAQITV